jgi:hypothetical protein
METGENSESSPPTLWSISKSAIFHYELEGLTEDNEKFPKNLFNAKVRTKNCNLTGCFAERERDCTNVCPDSTNTVYVTYEHKEYSQVTLITIRKGYQQGLK